MAEIMVSRSTAPSASPIQSAFRGSSKGAFPGSKRPAPEQGPARLQRPARVRRGHSPRLSSHWRRRLSRPIVPQAPWPCRGRPSRLSCPSKPTMARPRGAARAHGTAGVRPADLDRPSFPRPAPRAPPGCRKQTGPTFGFAWILLSQSYGFKELARQIRGQKNSRRSPPAGRGDAVGGSAGRRSGFMIEA